MVDDSFSDASVTVFGLDADPGRSETFGLTLSSQGLRLHGPTTLEIPSTFFKTLTQEDRHWILTCHVNERLLSIYGEHENGAKRLKDYFPFLITTASERSSAGFLTDRVAAREWFHAGVAMLVLSIAAVLLYPHMVKLVVNQIPKEWEIKWGQSAWDTARAPELADPVVNEAIKKLCAPLIRETAQSGYPIDIRIVRYADVNAYALPGGHIALFAGLIAEAESPKEVQGVLAHEISHVLLRHGLYEQVHQAGFKLILPLLTGRMSSFYRVLWDEGGELLGLRYSRSQESQADASGYEILRRSGVNPSGLLSFFERLSKGESSELVQKTKWLSTHPLSRERLDALKKLGAGLPTLASPGPSLHWKDIRRRCGKH